MADDDAFQSRCGSCSCFFSLSDHTIYDAIKFPEIQGKRCCGSFNNADARGWLMITDDNNNEWGLFQPWCRIQLQLPTLPRRRPYDKTRVRAAAMSDYAQVVAVVYNSSFLAFCRIGDDVWTDIPQSSALPPSKWHIDDVIYHRGQFYALTMGGSVGILRMNAAMHRNSNRRGKRRWVSTNLSTSLFSSRLGLSK
ncbi:hypothetical protein AAC387_Pa06g1188 [Persea americana]